MVRDVAAPATRHKDFRAELFRPIQHDDAMPRRSRFRGKYRAGEPRGAATDDGRMRRPLGASLSVRHRFVYPASRSARLATIVTNSTGSTGFTTCMWNPARTALTRSSGRA